MAMTTTKLLLQLLLTLTLGQVAFADAPITALTISPDGQQLVVGSQAGLSILRTANQESIRAVPTKLEHIHDVVFSPDGQLLLAVGGTPAETGAAELYTWPDTQLKLQFTVAEDLLTRAAWSSDSSWFASSCHDGVCRINNLQGGSTVRYTGHSRSILTLNVLTHDKQIISAGVDQTIQLWSLTGERQRTLNNHTGTVTDLAVNAGTNSSLRLASCGEDRTVRLWQPEIGRMIKFLRLDTIPRRVLWYPTDQLVAACDDGAVHIIDADQMSIVQTLKSNVHPIYEISLADDGIFVAGEGGIELLRRP